MRYKDAKKAMHVLPLRASWRCALQIGLKRQSVRLQLPIGCAPSFGVLLRISHPHRRNEPSNHRRGEMPTRIPFVCIPRMQLEGRDHIGWDKAWRCRIPRFRTHHSALPSRIPTHLLSRFVHTMPRVLVPLHAFHIRACLTAMHAPTGHPRMREETP